MEHYADGDVVNCRTKFAREPASLETMATWGPHPSKAFMTGRMEDLEEKPAPVEVRQGAVAA